MIRAQFTAKSGDISDPNQAKLNCENKALRIQQLRDQRLFDQSDEIRKFATSIGMTVKCTPDTTTVLEVDPTDVQIITTKTLYEDVSIVCGVHKKIGNFLLFDVIV